MTGGLTKSAWVNTGGDGDVGDDKSDVDISDGGDGGSKLVYSLLSILKMFSYVVCAEMSSRVVFKLYPTIRGFLLESTDCQ